MSLLGSQPWLSSGIRPVLRASLPLGAVLQAQWRGGVFGRYDILLRSLVAQRIKRSRSRASSSIEAQWYRHMQQERAGRDTWDAFGELMTKVDQVGFSDDYPIGISPRGSLLDGAHRMGIALADNVEQVFVDIRMGKRLRSFERRWFVDHGFDQEALERMDLELDRVMAHTGVDTVLVTPETNAPVSEWLRPLLPAGIRVVRQWSVSLEHDQASELESQLRSIPWHHQPAADSVPGRQLGEGALSVVRLRLTHHSLQRVHKTHTAIDQVAQQFESDIRSATGRPVVVGQTYEQNRRAWRILADHGWTHQAGSTWP